ncbi:ATP-dependent DNA helicase RecG [Owenweeksia hongkongensis]|uniref:ATP-dependent DNA helicase RecG n=1 Tax=Owenweeksia hongkongensis TaxID=253245 RepID=UPI003A9303F2
MQILQTPIEYLKGVGPAKADLLKKELRIFTYRDLLNLFPFRYVDRSRFYKINEISSTETEVQIIGKITKLEEVGAARAKRLTAHFVDETGSVELVWFKGVKWLKNSLKLNQPYVLFAKPSMFNNRYNFAHPDLELLEEFKASPLQGLQPVYPSTEKLNGRNINARTLAKFTQTLLPQLKGALPEIYPPEFLKENGLTPREASYFEVHFPKNVERLEKARYRLKFDEFFMLQLDMIRQKKIHQIKQRGFAFSALGENFNNFYNNELPFELTGAQKKVLKEIRKDIMHGLHMNRLVQGDVGSGKTIVALMCMLMAIDNGFQACLMAPTEILATQHYNGLKELVENLPVEIALLTGSTKAAARRELHAKLEDGSLHILIGTHALIEDKVKYKNLGMAVIDEQHRFGVAQRAQLWKKNTLPPHILIMTATPIPRTLAMSVYGNLDISVIDELPPGRKPITTVHRYDTNRLKVFGFMKEEIAKGRQVYVVYPLIEESKQMDYKDLQDGYESIVRAFPKSDYQVSIVHGKMKAADKEWEMQRFAKGETQIMVATTVIEVGVNVPNASVMVIESAERFGLSQLHQLRGRVGRGAEQSFCILMTSHKLSSDAKTRIKTMVRTNDGFEISEVDMKLRGPGDLMGTRQSGILNLNIADLMKDGAILEQARNAAITLLEKDPQLRQPEHYGILQHFNSQVKRKMQWGRIS